MDNEPKKTVDQTADEFFNKLDGATDGEQQPESSPATEQSVETSEDGSDPAKTPSTESADSYKGADKGFASHPAWIERENKLKEAQAKLEQSSGELARLLDDPRIYKKYLESKGYQPAQVAHEMARRGFKVEDAAEQRGLDKETKRSIAEAACEKLGWNINALTPEQRAYINDHVALTEQVIEAKLGETLDKRLAPIEGFLRDTQNAERDRVEFEEVKKAAMAEFPEEFKKDPQYWSKVIEPAMNAYLDELDKKDPQRRQRIDWQTLYERSTRQILKEKRTAEESQEARDGAKKNARPLVPGASIPTTKKSELKGKTVGETADKFLDSIGFKA